MPKLEQQINMEDIQISDADLRQAIKSWKEAKDDLAEYKDARDAEKTAKEKVLSMLPPAGDVVKRFRVDDLIVVSTPPGAPREAVSFTPTSKRRIRLETQEDGVTVASAPKNAKGGKGKPKK